MVVMLLLLLLYLVYLGRTELGSGNHRLGGGGALLERVATLGYKLIYMYIHLETYTCRWITDGERPAVQVDEALEDQDLSGKVLDE